MAPTQLVARGDSTRRKRERQDGANECSTRAARVIRVRSCDLSAAGDAVRDVSSRTILSSR